MSINSKLTYITDPLLFTACVDGEVLLYNGSHSSPNFTRGTVLVCYDNSYGTVCDDFWDKLEAMVVCKQLGYEENSVLKLELLGIFPLH